MEPQRDRLTIPLILLSLAIIAQNKNMLHMFILYFLIGLPCFETRIIKLIKHPATSDGFKILPHTGQRVGIFQIFALVARGRATNGFLTSLRFQSR